MLFEGFGVFSSRPAVAAVGQHKEPYRAWEGEYDPEYENKYHPGYLTHTRMRTKNEEDSKQIYNERPTQR